MKKATWRNVKHNHWFMMVICCAVPLVIISLLSAGGVLGSWGTYALFLLCPLLHIFMMRGHSSRHGEPGNDAAGIAGEAEKNFRREE